MKKEIIKPFDLEKAKAGAKLRTRNGLHVEIFKWDARGSYPIRGIVIAEKEDKSEINLNNEFFNSNINTDEFTSTKTENKSQKLDETLIAGPNGLQYASESKEAKHAIVDEFLKKLSIGK